LIKRRTRRRRRGIGLATRGRRGIGLATGGRREGYCWRGTSWRRKGYLWIIGEIETLINCK